MLHILENLSARELMPGFVGRFVHGDGCTMAFWDVQKGAELPEHAHPHEQLAHVVEGTFELTVDGEPHVLEAGSVLVIPGDVPHSGRALTDCRILDVFQPARDEYR